MNKFLKRAQELKPQMIAWRRQVHENPEIGMDLPKTVALVKEELVKMGYQPVLCGGGVIAVLEGGLPGKTFLIRGDMDALPMQEDSGLPFASKVPNVAHTCGHDTHTAMLLGAAQILMENKKNIVGKIKLMFQPGEEIGEGARRMIGAGLLENPDVDAAFGLHSLVATDIASGKIAYNLGPSLASVDMFRIDVAGKGTHGSRPETGVDPINILCHIQNTIQTIITRERPQEEAAVLTICQFIAGDAPNIIPNSGYMTGSIRTFNQEVREFIKQRLKEISEETARLLKGEAKVTFISGMPPTTNNEEVGEALADYFRDMIGPENVVSIPARMASEDFSEVSSRVPSAFFRISMGSNQEGHVYGGHNPKVIFDEEALPVGAAAYAYGAVRWLEEKN